MNTHERRLARLEAAAPPALDDVLGQLIWQHGNDVRTWPESALEAATAGIDPALDAWVCTLTEDELNALVDDRPDAPVPPAGIVLERGLSRLVG